MSLAAERERWQMLDKALGRVEKVLVPEFLRGDWTKVDMIFRRAGYLAGKLYREVQTARETCRRRMAEILDQQRVGGVLDQPRARLALNTALSLKSAGLPVTKSRDGLFAGVLGVCLEFGGGHRPQEMFELVSRALEEVDQLTQTS